MADQTNDPLWIAVPATDPFTATTHGEHHVEFVSRHAIAETGLRCPSCQTEVSPIGDYTMVRHSRLGDVIKCNGKRIIQDEEYVCGMFLAASPDTEHGDHLIYDKTPKEDRFELFYRFVRISEGDAAKLRYGPDAVLSVEGEVFASKAPPGTSPVERPRLIFKVGQVWQTDDERQVQILRVQTDGDPMFDGWAWGIFLNTEPFEWNIDPSGLVRQTMRDPTLNDRARLLHEIRPN